MLVPPTLSLKTIKCKYVHLLDFNFYLKWAFELTIAYLNKQNLFTKTRCLFKTIQHDNSKIFLNFNFNLHINFRVKII